MSPVARDRTILVVEDHALFAEILTLALGAEGFDVRRLVPSEREEASGRLLAAVAKERPDIVLLDLDLGRHGDGSRLVRPLTRLGCQVIVVTGNLDQALWGYCLHQGAWAIFTKHEPLEDLVDLARRVADRERVVSVDDHHALTALWFERRAEDEQVRQRLTLLSPREQEVLGALMEGRNIRDIAAGAVVSPATVRTQVHSILTKLHVQTQLAAVGLAHRVGWRPPAPRR